MIGCVTFIYAMVQETDTGCSFLITNLLSSCRHHSFGFGVSWWRCQLQVHSEAKMTSVSVCWSRSATPNQE